jgi:hypothetical protein
MMNWDVGLTEILLLTISYVLLLKGLNLRRFTPLGKWLALNNIAFSFVYFCAALAWAVEPFRTTYWSYFVRLLILYTILRVLIEMSRAFGGWWVIHVRAWHSLTDWVTGRPQREEIYREGY